MSTKLYTVVAGDYLAKIAAEHGTTVGAIWQHELNHNHRLKRGSPDVLYAGDVLHIPIVDDDGNADDEYAWPPPSPPKLPPASELGSPPFVPVSFRRAVPLKVRRAKEKLTPAANRIASRIHFHLTAHGLHIQMTAGRLKIVLSLLRKLTRDQLTITPVKWRDGGIHWESHKVQIAKQVDKAGPSGKVAAKQALPTGTFLLRTLVAAKKNIAIVQASRGDKDAPRTAYHNKVLAREKSEGVPNVGSGSTVHLNHLRSDDAKPLFTEVQLRNGPDVGRFAIEKIPPMIIVGHELVHAWRALHGMVIVLTATAPWMHRKFATEEQLDVMETIGARGFYKGKPFNKDPVSFPPGHREWRPSENNIRKDHGMSERTSHDPEEGPERVL